MRALAGIVWWRLLEWAEKIAPELGDFWSDDEDDQ